MGEQNPLPAVADVYAGDAQIPNGVPDAQAGVYVYRIEAEPDPDVLLRIAAVCNLANVAPRRVEFELQDADVVTARVDMARINASTAESIRRKLLQLTCVTAVRLEFA